MRILVNALSIKTNELIKKIEEYENIEVGFTQKLAKTDMLCELATIYTYYKELKKAVNAYKGKPLAEPDDGAENE